MRTVIYTVKIPKADKPDEFEVIEFDNRKSCCEFLNIGQNTLYSLSTNRIKLSHSTKKHLEGIVIEKRIVEGVKSKKSKEKLTKESYQQDLINKIASMKK